MKKLIVGIVGGLLLSTSLSFAEDYTKVIKTDTYNMEDYKSICRFQASANIEVDKSLGEITRGLFGKEYLKVTDTIPHKMDLVVVNKDTKSLTFYKQNGDMVKYPVALGKKGSTTPSGKRKIVNKIVNPYWGGMNGKYKPIKGGDKNNPLGKRWLGIGGDYGIHGNNDEGSIGKYISSGCIRAYNQDIETIFKIVPSGTEVWVGTTKELEKWGVKQVVAKETIGFQKGDALPKPNSTDKELPVKDEESDEIKNNPTSNKNKTLSNTEENLDLFKNLEFEKEEEIPSLF